MIASTSAPRKLFRSAALALALALLGAASMVYYHLGLFMPRVREVSTQRHLAGEYSFGGDFYPIWLTSRRWIRDHRDPYSPELTREIQIGLFGRPLDSHVPTDPPSDYRTFAYPAFTDLLFWPLSEIPFRILRIAWSALLVVLLGGNVVFWSRALAWQLNAVGLAIAILLTICSYQELEGLYAGQIGLLVGFLLSASLLALVRERPVLAGISMALTTIKPQMVILAILYLILWSASDWRKRGRFTISFFATMFLLIASSLLVWPHWIQSWINVIRAYPHYAMPPLASEVLGSNLRSYLGTPVIALLLVVAIVLAWRGRTAAVGSYSFWLTLGSLLALTTVTLAPGQAVHDHVILLPAIFLLVSRERLCNAGAIFRWLFAVGVAVVLWPWLAAACLTALRPFLRPEVFYSEAVFALPLRTAAALPFVVIGLLVLAHRAATPEKESRLLTSIST
jgi:hypothetical protein